MTAPDPQAIRDAADRAEQLRQNATPGPWVVNNNYDDEVLTGDWVDMIAYAPHRPADAALIAATPELLSVLVPAARTAADLLDAVEELPLRMLAALLSDECRQMHGAEGGYQGCCKSADWALMLSSAADAVAAARGDRTDG